MGAHPETMREAIAAHDGIITKHADANGGHVSEHTALGTSEAVALMID